MKIAILVLLPNLVFANSAFAECDTLPPYWCNDGSYAKDLMDAIQQNNLEEGTAQVQQQKQLAEQKRQLAIQENLKWLNESEGKGYVATSQRAAQVGQSCALGTLMMAMFAKPPARGGQAEPACQQVARNNLEEARYESLAFYRRENKIKPLRKGVDNPDSQESLAAKAYRNKRFEADLMGLPSERRNEFKALNAGLEANVRLCAEKGDALACHEMITKPFAAAFKELSGQTIGGRGYTAAPIAASAQPQPVAAETRVLPPVPRDLKLPENGEYDPYATQRWTCKVGFVQAENRCQKQ